MHRDAQSRHHECCASFSFCESLSASTAATDLRGGGCAMPMSRAEIQHITILSQGVIILKHCYLDLKVKARHSVQGIFF